MKLWEEWSPEMLIIQLNYNRLTCYEILSAALYGCEMCYLILSEKHELPSVWKKFGPKNEIVEQFILSKAYVRVDI